MCSSAYSNWFAKKTGYQQSLVQTPIYQSYAELSLPRSHQQPSIGPYQQRSYIPHHKETQRWPLRQSYVPQRPQQNIQQPRCMQQSPSHVLQQFQEPHPQSSKQPRSHVPQPLSHVPQQFQEPQSFKQQQPRSHVPQQFQEPQPQSSNQQPPSHVPQQFQEQQPPSHAPQQPEKPNPQGSMQQPASSMSLPHVQILKLLDQVAQELYPAIAVPLQQQTQKQETPSHDLVIWLGQVAKGLYPPSNVPQQLQEPHPQRYMQQRPHYPRKRNPLQMVRVFGKVAKLYKPIFWIQRMNLRKRQLSPDYKRRVHLGMFSSFKMPKTLYGLE